MAEVYEQVRKPSQACAGIPARVYE